MARDHALDQTRRRVPSAAPAATLLLLGLEALHRMATQTQDASWGDFGDEAASATGAAGVCEEVWGRTVSSHPAYPHTELRGDSVTFGRNAKCDVLVQAPAVSGFHCRVLRERASDADDAPAVVFVEDMSTNGTFVNGRKIGRGNRQVISHGQEVVLIPRGRNGERELVSFFFYFREDEAKQKQLMSGPGEKYDVRELLGTGAFAAVRLCVDRTDGKQYALKVIDKKRYMLQGSSRPGALMDEVTILRSLSHPHIIQVFDVFESDASLFIVLELATGGELFDKLVSDGRFSEELARSIFSQLLSATMYLHSKGVVHRDLKPENILLSSCNGDVNVKVTDFGLSRILSEGSFMTTICGTPQYIAPEVIDPETCGTNGYSMKVDMWSLGVLLYVFLSASVPFDERRSDMPIQKQIISGEYNFPREPWDDISEDAKDLIRGLLQVDPKQRLSGKQVENHPWLAPISKFRSGATEEPRKKRFRHFS